MLSLQNSSRSKVKVYLQRGTLFLLVGVIGFTIFQPAEVMALYTLMNPTKGQRQAVSPLSTATNDVRALPKLSESGSLNELEKKPDEPRDRVKELTEKRTAFTKTFLNSDGTKTLDYTPYEQNFKDGDTWKSIDNSVKNTADPEEFRGKAGKISAELKPIFDGVTVEAEGRTITFKPMGARDIVPVKSSDSGVIYKDVWPNVDIEYELRGQAVKEIIIVKDKSAQTSFDFAVDGGKVVNHPTQEGALAIEGLSDDYKISQLSLDVNGRGVISEKRVSQAPTEAGMRIQLDKEWFNSQDAKSFPMRIDPTFTKQSQISLKMFKSDGYSCDGSICYINTGSLYDGGWKHWRTLINIPYTELQNKTVLNADLHGYYKTGIGGDTTTRSIGMSVANCSNSFSCYGTTAMSDSSVSTSFDIDFTAKLKALVDADDYSTWWGLKGVESSSTTTYKPYYDLKATITYDTPTPMSVAASPANKATVVTTQPSLRVNNVTDADGDDVQYYFRVATNPDAETGAVINSGWITSSQWTVPANILQDGRTYYWHVYTRGYAQTNPAWVRSFKVDMRTGKDSTQAYEELGPIAADLATGNVTTSTSSHSISALGGDIGLSLNYNSPAMSAPGLSGQYWNNTSFSGTPVMQRVDPDINFAWASGSPAGGVVNVDNFSSRWTGYLTAPTTGDYYFGCNVDDTCKVYLDDQLYFNRTSYGSSYSTTAIHLDAGKPVKIKVEQTDIGSTAAMQLKVKGAVTEQVVPASWFDTGAQDLAKKYGLTGYYYNDPSGTKAFPTNTTDPNRLLMVRSDNKIGFNWGSGAASPGLPSDKFLVRWKGYITVPSTGSYTLGGVGDDGMRIKLGTGLGGSDETVLDSWSDLDGNRWGTAKNLTAGQTIPITVEYVETTGTASFKLLIRGTSLAEQEMPVTWLAPNANVLPDGWDLGYGDGDVNFERLDVLSNAVVLSDSTGQKYEYTWQDGGYKPPKGQEAMVLRNDDNTYTVIDTDGKNYIFDALGQLKSISSPEDDKQPASLKYEYAGNPSRLVKIIDGVNSARNGTLHYSGDSECQTMTGFDTAPAGYLCAFKTTDGKKTTLQYKAGNLSRIVLPGDDYEDYGYDSLGRIISFRDSLANDAVAYGMRANDVTVATEMTYDGLGRISTVTYPAATVNASREQDILTYLQNSTELHVNGAPEPHGFSRRVGYDSLFRTTSDTDLANLTTTTEWDPNKDLVLSTIDPSNLKSTIIYNDNDLPIDSYGPAPSSWYDGNRKPLPEKIHTIPHTSMTYDESITGPAVSWYNYQNGSLTGAPLLHKTGFYDNDPSFFRMNTTDSTSPVVPVQPTNGASNVGFRANGKIKVPSTGSYTLTLSHANAARVYINDSLVIDGWDYRSNTVVTKTATVSLSATESNRFLVEYANVGGGNTSFRLTLGTNNGYFGETMLPDYNLQTSTTVFDAQLGNTVVKTAYSSPEYGRIGSTTFDPGGLNLQTQVEHEAAGEGFMRQKSKSLPGGAKTLYQYYSATETRDNPCTSQSESYLQAGLLKGSIEPDPDKDGPAQGRSNEAIYDDAGRVVATRYNDDPWTCMSYDDSGRVIETSIPMIGDKPGRTITNNYLVNGSPLKTSISDNTGTITTEVDLLGRVIKYVDSRGNITTNSYDEFGYLLSRQSPKGDEEFEYNDYGWLIKQKMDGEILSETTYDSKGFIDTVDYPQMGDTQKLDTLSRDSLGRLNKIQYTVEDGTEYSDEIGYSQSNQVTSNNRSIDGTTLESSYTYDKVDRLTKAIIGNDVYEYGFTSSDATCGSEPTNNPNAGLDSNRTSLKINGQETTYCYDFADRLIKSSDQNLNEPEYDNHGNTIKIGSNATPLRLEYDSEDRNMALAQLDNSGDGTKITYKRDAQDRIVEKKQTIITNGQSDDKYGYFGFAGSSDVPDFIQDENNHVVEKYIQLMGGILLTIRPDESDIAKKTTQSFTNLHGDIVLTTNGLGVVTGQYSYDPFGNKISNSLPLNSQESSYGWEGASRKQQESKLISQPMQLGTRVYLPSLGRFLQVDPVEGGTLNNYVYVQDPINQKDLSGDFSFGWVSNIAKTIFSQVRRVVNLVASKIKPKAQNKKSQIPVIIGSKKNSFSGRPYKSPSSKELDAYHRSKAGKGGYDQKDLKSFKKKQVENSKIQKSRNSQKRGNDDDDKNNPTAPPNIPSNPYTSPQRSSGPSAGQAAAVAGGGVAVGVVLWWVLKPAGVFCGPAAPICMAAL